MRASDLVRDAGDGRATESPVVWAGLRLIGILGSHLSLWRLYELNLKIVSGVQPMHAVPHVSTLLLIWTL